MKRLLIIACTLAAVTGCATVEKRFTVVTEPPDAEITVIPGGGEPVQTFASPAQVSVRIPEDPVIAARIRMEVKRDTYRTKTISLASIDDGQEVRIRLEKDVLHLLTFSLLSPQRSDDLTYRDRVLDASFAVRERNFEVTLQNRSAKPLKVLWEQASYTDYTNRPHRIMHGGIKMQDRHNAIPPMMVPLGESVKLEIMPVTLVTYSREKKTYESKPLFPLNSDVAQALKGRTFYLFLPVEMDRQIIPYNFRFQITDVTKGP